MDDDSESSDAAKNDTGDAFDVDRFTGMEGHMRLQL